MLCQGVVYDARSVAGRTLGGEEVCGGALRDEVSDDDGRSEGEGEGSKGEGRLHGDG